MRYLIIAMIVGPILAYMGWADRVFHQQIQAEGKTVAGTIQSGESRRSRRSKSHTFEVTYEPEGGQLRSKKFSVSSDYFKAHISGDSIGNDACEVRYLPSDPDKAIIVGGSNSQEFLMWFGLGVTAIGFFGTVGPMVLGSKKAAEPEETFSA